MTADDRLNQLEPLLSETMSILDRHTAQLKQLSFAISQVSTAVVQQGENISFLLREQLTMKAQQNDLKTQQDVMKTQQDVMKTQLDGVETQLDGVTGKLDHILQLLQKPGQ
ncbi:hypothetical protein [Hymenobacter siberiensis]|jgi:chromosome segregation ATPase|uniref:hypothetical protein n=1 Tax=Hymenobacter siberiensis TaxID=2848396 RepID=UPI001C1E2317|nr:hypothetical protein [Hymenobacter siberiensis]MBU6120610.1 hypothetical protein [Hymenobacter siberiensis]